MNNLDIQLSIHKDARRKIIEMLDKGFGTGLITKKERDLFYYRHIDWKTLEDCGKHFGVTRERIRQIEAKVLEKFRSVTANKD